MKIKMEKVKVYNESDTSPIKVAINRWGVKGNTEYCPINKNGSEIWERTDEKGFVMGIKGGAQEGNYYIKREDVIKVYEDKVTRNGCPIYKMPY